MKCADHCHSLFLERPNEVSDRAVFAGHRLPEKRCRRITCGKKRNLPGIAESMKQAYRHACGRDGEERDRHVDVTDELEADIMCDLRLYVAIQKNGVKMKK